MSYLLSFSLGPVQDFIAASRKTRDLWFGSQLLSDLARAAAQALKEGGAELIFPTAQSLVGAAPIPNKILAIVNDPKAMSDAAKSAARVALDKHAAQVWAKIEGRGLKNHVDRDLFHRQIEDFLEFYAAWWPYNPAHPEGYKEARHQAEKLLAGRKALRDFAPASGREGVPKSSLDGGRESVIDLSRASDDAHNRLNLRKGELLDGISLIKRLDETKRFVSVSRVAIDPILHRLNPITISHLNDLAGQLQANDSNLVQRFNPGDFPQFAGFPYDTELFYGELAEDEELDSENQRIAATFAREFASSAAAEPVSVREPLPYMVVLIADGDRVGKVLNEMGGPDEHRAFSEAGVKFALGAEEVVRNHHGALVYSGGDDVLAFLPLVDALDCANALHVLFAQTMLPLKLAEPPTLSVGLSIGHFNTPLDRLLDWGRKAEHAAKQDRNALAVALHTRTAGEESVTVRMSWKAGPVARWHRWIDALRQERLPDGAAYELRGLVRELRGLAKAGQEQVVGALLKPEMRRILAHKRGEHGAQKLASEDIDALVGPVVQGPSDADALLLRLEGLVNELVIARHFARAADQANGSLRGGPNE